MGTLFEHSVWKTSRKRHLKSKFALPQTLSRLFHIMYSSNVGKSFCSWIPKVSKFRERKRKLLLCFQSRPRQNEIRHLLVVVASDGIEMNKKAWSKPIAFLPTVFKLSWEDCLFARTTTYAKFKGQTLYYEAFEKDNSLSIPGVV